MRDAVGRLDVERDEFDVRIDAARTEEAPRQRVVERLVEFLIELRCDQRCKAAPDHEPQVAIAHAVAQQMLEPLRRRADAEVVEIDAFERVRAR